MSPRPKLSPASQSRACNAASSVSKWLRSISRPFRSAANSGGAEAEQTLLHLLVQKQAIHLVIELPVEPLLPATGLGAALRVGGKQRAFRIRFLEVFKDGAIFARDDPCAAY